MLRKILGPGFALITLLGTGCTIEGSGSQRAVSKSSSVSDSGDAAPEDAAGSEAKCLKLAEKSEHNLKLQEEGEAPAEEASEDAKACKEAPAEEAPAAEE